LPRRAGDEPLQWFSEVRALARVRWVIIAVACCAALRHGSAPHTPRRPAHMVDIYVRPSGPVGLMREPPFGNFVAGRPNVALW
jgi:hypothetical protein